MTSGRHSKSSRPWLHRPAFLSLAGIAEILHCAKWAERARVGKALAGLVCSHKQPHFLLLNKNRNWQFVKPRKQELLDYIEGLMNISRAYGDPGGEAYLGFHSDSENLCLENLLQTGQEFFLSKFQFKSPERCWAGGRGLAGKQFTSVKFGNSVPRTIINSEICWNWKALKFSCDFNSLNTGPGVYFKRCTWPT